MGSPKKKNAGLGLSRCEPIGLPALRKLTLWFSRNRRVLPWREDPSLYRVWISEIMLQQTQVITVLPYFDRFMTAFPTVQHLAAAKEESVLKAWEGLGYYSRARNLLRAAKFIVEHGFPQTRDAWLEVPGVGPYTAGAITSIALGLPEPIVDGNVERVFARMRCLKRGNATSEKRYKETLWSLSRHAVEKAFAAGLSPSELNQAWMELGATICAPRNPMCHICPVVGACEAKRADDVDSFPTKKKRTDWIRVVETRMVLLNISAGKVYLEKTAKGEWREGLWDFPVAIPKGSRGESLGEIHTKHVVTRHKIERKLEIYSLMERGSQLGKVGRWITLADPEVPISSAPKKGIQALIERFF